MVFSSFPALTDRGICYTFNSKHPSQFLKRSQFVDSFNSVFGMPTEPVIPLKVSGTNIELFSRSR